MNAQDLADRISKGMGVAARRSGSLVSVFRPVAIGSPLAPQNRIIDLFAAFLPSGAAGGMASYGRAMCQGIYDSSYTQPGDYLVGTDGTYFVVSQKPGLPVQCVQTNRTVSIVRPQPAAQGTYSGFFAVSGEPILAEWPGSLLAGNPHSMGGTVEQTRFGDWTLLLPPMVASPQIADVVNDDVGAVYVISGAESSTLGWRITVRQVGP